MSGEITTEPCTSSASSGMHTAVQARAPRKASSTTVTSGTSKNQGNIDVSSNDVSCCPMENDFLIPKGPWTMQTHRVSSNFTEISIKSYTNKKNAKKHFIRGYNFFMSDKVKYLVLHYFEKGFFIKGKVQASYTLNTIHKTEVKVGHKGTVLSGYCSCKSSKGGVCSHVCACLWAVLDSKRSGSNFVKISNKSCTDMPRKWGLSKSTSAVNVSKFSDLPMVKHLPGKKVLNLEFARKRKEKDKLNVCTVTTSMLQTLHSDLTNSNKNNILCLNLEQNLFLPQKVNDHVFDDVCTDAFMPEVHNSSNRIKLPTEILWQSEFKDIVKTSVTSFCELTLEECYDIEQQTVLQGLCELWKFYKKRLLSSSNFGKVVRRKVNVNSKFVDYIFKSSRYSSNYMKEGLDNEDNACSKYLLVKKGYCVYKVGLIINPGVPCLATSPDRVVCCPDGTFGLLEIKTLCKAKSLGLSINKAVTLKMGIANNLNCSNGFLKLKENSDHFYQIQGQLALTGLKFCDYIVDCGSEFYVETIHFDPNLWTKIMLPKLIKFCMVHTPKDI